MKCTKARELIKQWRNHDKNARVCYKIDDDRGIVTLLLQQGNKWVSYVCEQDMPAAAEAVCRDCSYHHNEDRCPYPLHKSTDNPCEDFLSNTTFDAETYNTKSPEYEEWERQNNLYWWYYWNKRSSKNT